MFFFFFLCLCCLVNQSWHDACFACVHALKYAIQYGGCFNEEICLKGHVCNKQHFLRKDCMGLFHIRDFNIVTCFESPVYTALFCTVQDNHHGRSMMMWLQNKGPVSHWETSADCRCHGLATKNRPVLKHDSVSQKFRMIVTCCDCHQDPRLPANQRKCSMKGCVDHCAAQAMLK